MGCWEVHPTGYGNYLPALNPLESVLKNGKYPHWKHNPKGYYGFPKRLLPKRGRPSCPLTPRCWLLCRVPPGRAAASPRTKILPAFGVCP